MSKSREVFETRYSDEDRLALSYIVAAIARVAKVSRTFTVQHVREELGREGYARPTQEQERRLMATAFCIARRKERGICFKTKAYVPTADTTGNSKSARIVWTSCYEQVN
jgi:hypothetical protein